MNIYKMKIERSWKNIYTYLGQDLIPNSDNRASEGFLSTVILLRFDCDALPIMILITIHQKTLGHQEPRRGKEREREVVQWSSSELCLIIYSVDFSFSFFLFWFWGGGGEDLYSLIWQYKNIRKHHNEKSSPIYRSLPSWTPWMHARTTYLKCFLICICNIILHIWLVKFLIIIMLEILDYRITY